MVNIPPIKMIENGDDWGMVRLWHCFTNITSHPGVSLRSFFQIMQKSWNQKFWGSQQGTLFEVNVGAVVREYM